MDQKRDISFQYTIGSIFLCFVLISAFPSWGYSQYYQVLPESCKVEQVFTPFSAIDKSCDFHFAYHLDAEGASSETLNISHQYILKVVNHSIAVLFRVKRSQLFSAAGKQVSMLFIRFSPDDQDDDDICT